MNLEIANFLFGSSSIGVILRSLGKLCGLSRTGSDGPCACFILLELISFWNLGRASMAIINKTFLGIGLSGFALLMPLVVPEVSKAADECADSGTVASLTAECLHTPDRFYITIHEMGLCTSNPLDGAVGSKTLNLTSCTASMARDTTGVSGDLAGSGTFDLPYADTRPPSNTYPYAYIILGKTIGLRGSYALSNGTTYYSDSTGSSLSTTGPAVNHSEDLEDFGDGSFDAEWATDGTESISGSGKISAMLLNSGFTRSTSASATKYLVGVFQPDSGNEVVITDSTKGVAVELQVTKAGYIVVPNDGTGVPEEFGSAPFRPVFTID